MTVKEVSAPPNRYCKACLEAPELFRRLGTKAPEEPMLFFRVSCDIDVNVNGTYCERCLIIANALKEHGR